jgi:hypothetical protein
MGGEGMKYYVLTVYGGTDPALTEAFLNESERDEEAVTMLREIDAEEDAVFCIDVDEEGELDIYRFELPEEEEEYEDDEEEEDRRKE